MVYRLERLAAHLSDQNTYDPPSDDDLLEIFAEMQRSREFADMLYLSIQGGGNVVTFAEQDIETLADLRNPSEKSLPALSVTPSVEQMQLQIEQQQQEIARLNSIINSPLNNDFLKGVSVEAEHQLQRWSRDHDARKNGWDWFWAIGYLSQKAAAAFEAGDFEKAKHHCISTAALLKSMHQNVTEHQTRAAANI